MKKALVVISIMVVVIVSVIFSQEIQKTIRYDSAIESISTKINKSFNIKLNEGESIEIIVTKKDDKDALKSETLISYTVSEGRKADIRTEIVGFTADK